MNEVPLDRIFFSSHLRLHTEFSLCFLIKVSSYKLFLMSTSLLQCTYTKSTITNVIWKVFEQNFDIVYSYFVKAICSITKKMQVIIAGNYWKIYRKINSKIVVRNSGVRNGGKAALRVGRGKWIGATFILPTWFFFS